MIHTPITADLSIADAARLMMAEQLAIVYEHLPALRQGADGLAVHETRKAIRRTFTLFKLFAPTFAPKALEPHRRTLRRGRPQQFHTGARTGGTAHHRITTNLTHRTHHARAKPESISRHAQRVETHPVITQHDAHRARLNTDLDRSPGCCSGVTQTVFKPLPHRPTHRTQRR